MTTVHKAYEIASFKARPNEGEGTFEAVVSVFGNVDLQGDRVMPGAFEKSIQKWTDSGDKLPVVWSHDWADPFAHIGWIDPKDMREVRGKAGQVPGGLLVKGHLDVHKPFAKQVFDLLAERRVKEWSFSYDIPAGGESRGKDGANELNTVEVIEVGPTLKGANQSTITLGTKSANEDAERERRVKLRLNRAATAELMMGFKWDGGAAMQKCHSAADYRKIAFERANDSDPDTAAHWALPHHPSPGADADPAGVSAALAALHGGRGGAPDLKNKAAAESHLSAHSGSSKAQGKPWHVEKRGDEWCVIKDADDSQVACHPTEEAANAQVRALYASEKGFTEGQHPRDSEGRFTDKPGGGGGGDHREELTGRSTEDLQTIANAPGALPDVRRIATEIIGERTESWDTRFDREAHITEAGLYSSTSPAQEQADADVLEELVSTGLLDEDTLDEVADPTEGASDALNGLIAGGHVTQETVDEVRRGLGQKKSAGRKAGRVVGAKAAAALKDALAGAVDSWASKMNGTDGDGDTAQEKSAPDPLEPGDKKDFARGYADGSAGRKKSEDITGEYVRGFDDGIADRATMADKEIEKFNAIIESLK